MHLTDDDQQFRVRAGSAHIDTTCSSCSMDTTSRRRLRLRNRPVAREPGCGSFQRVYDMGGHEVCAVRTDAALAEVQATVARILDLRGSLAETVRLRRYSATASSSSEGTRDWQFLLDPSMIHKDDLAFHLTSLCVVCSGRFGEEGCFYLEPSDACILCSNTLCCTRCSHIWRSQPMKNDDDEEVKPGNPICALCMTPAMLDAEAANVTRHFRIAALAWME